MYYRYAIPIAAMTLLFASCAATPPPQTVCPDGNGAQTPAAIGKPAPNFTLADLEGNPVELASFAGKIVVLEWFNPECPFVATAHERDFSLDNMADRYRDRDVVWLAINSQDKEGMGWSVEANKAAKEKLKMTYPLLRDEGGKVGRLYGAERTPHLFVINKEGILVYSGAIDNTMGGDLDDAPPPPPLHFPGHALDRILAKDLVQIEQTEAWG